MVFGKQEKKCCPLGSSACVATWHVSDPRFLLREVQLAVMTLRGVEGGMPSHSPQITHHPEKSHTQSRGPRYKYFISVTIVPHQNYSSTRR